MNALALEQMTPNGPGIHLMRPSTVLGGAAQHNIWTVAGGPILILALWGIVRNVAMDATGSTLSIDHSTVPTALCGDLAEILLDPIGTVYYMEGVQASLLVKAENGDGSGCPATAVAQLTPIPFTVGDIECGNDGAQDGEIEWHLVYRVLDPLATVINAAAY